MNQLEIELKNGRRLVLEMSPLFLEYVQDYDGGMEQLEKDAGTTYALNQLLYAIIASNYDKPLTYSQAVKLVKMEDMEKIIDFINKELPEINGQASSSMNRPRHRR